jgi:hypothetical protein
MNELSQLQKDYLMNRYAIYYLANFLASYGIVNQGVYIEYPDRDRRAQASLEKRGLIHQVQQSWRGYEWELTDAGVQLASDLWGSTISERCFQAWADALTLSYFEDYQLASEGIYISKVSNGIVYAHNHASGVGQIFFNSNSRDTHISFASGLWAFTGSTVDRFGFALENVEYLQGILLELRS